MLTFFESALTGKWANSVVNSDIMHRAAQQCFQPTKGAAEAGVRQLFEKVVGFQAGF